MTKTKKPWTKPEKLSRPLSVVYKNSLGVSRFCLNLYRVLGMSLKATLKTSVTQPQALPYRNGLRVLDIELASGGLTEFASPNRARIVREVNGKTIEQKVRLGDLLNKGELSQNYELHPGDVLIVPQSMF